MQLSAILLSFLIAAVAAVQDDHPVGSVIALLQELRYKVQDEYMEEEETFHKLKKWCDDSKYTLASAVKDNKEAIDALSNEVEAKTIEEKSIKDHIAFLEEEILKYEAEDSSAEEMRNEAKALYEKADADYDTTISAIGEALTALKESKSAALLQFLKPQNKRQERALRQLARLPMVLEQLSAEQRQALSAAAFGSADPADEEVKVTEEDIMKKKKYAQTGQTYTFKSGGVIELLEKLETHFKDEKTAATKAETAAINEYQVAKDARKDALDTAKSTKDQKTTDLSDTQEDLNTAKSSLSDEKDELKSNSETLKNTEDTCDTKASEFKERQKLRNQEMEAMKVAIRILEKVSGTRTDKPENEPLPAAPADAPSGGESNALNLLQSINPQAKMKAVNLIKQEAARSHSKALARFADQLAAKADGPFDEINGMIQQMIFRLMDEQKDEDAHKAWCDVEVSTSERSNETKTEKLKTLDTEIADKKALADELELKVNDLNKKVEDLTKFIAEATEVRAKAKKENDATIKDAKEAQDAIAKATAVLETYYKETGMIEKEPWEFIQEPAPVELPEQPESWDSSYTGVADPTKPGGVIAVLKATAEKFSKLESETRAQEVGDQQQFNEVMKSEKINKARTEKEAEMKEDERKRTVDKVHALEKRQKQVRYELGAVQGYLKDLKPACIDGDSTYEDRKAARQKEVDALKDAQKILEDAFEEKTESFLQTVRKHF